MPNMSVAHPDVEVQNLLHNSLLSVSSAGTVGFESLLFGIPSVGNRFSFLNGVPGFVNLQKLNARTLRTAALELKSISISDLIASVCLQSQAGSPNGSLNMFYKPEESTNCRALASSIDRLFKGQYRAYRVC